jgi:hypothetical protein
MKKIIISISIFSLLIALTTSCGGKKEDTKTNEVSKENEVIATSSERSEMEESTENEKSTTDKIEEKAKQAKDKVVEKVNEGKEASRPLLNRMKGKLKEKMEQKGQN